MHVICVSINCLQCTINVIHTKSNKYFLWLTDVTGIIITLVHMNGAVVLHNPFLHRFYSTGTSFQQFVNYEITLHYLKYIYKLSSNTKITTKYEIYYNLIEAPYVITNYF